MNLSETFWLTIASQASTLLTFAVSFLYFLIPKEKRDDYWEVAWVFIVSATADVIQYIGTYILHTSMNFAGSVYIILQFLLLISLYRKKVAWTNKDILAGITSVLFTILAIANLFFFQGINGLNSYTTIVASGILAVLSIVYFSYLAKDATPDSIVKTPMFWIDTGVLIYHGGSFFLFLTADYLIKALNNNLISFWLFYHVLWLIFILMTAYAFILVKSTDHK